jgi:Protein of unknown function (DUF3105)
MPRKDRVPNPPKRPQAPQRRHAQSDPAVAARRRRNLLVGIGAAALVAAGIALTAVLAAGGGTDERQVLEDAGCTLQTFTGQEGTHVEMNAKPKWNSHPPTSGPHFGTPAIWGEYDAPVQLIQSVHNLEHGGVVIHYGSDVAEATITQVRDFYNEDPNGLIVAPLPSLRPKNAIALSAWTASEGADGLGYLAKCTKFDEKAFSTFLDEHRYQGPERFPPDLLTPGS